MKKEAARLGGLFCITAKIKKPTQRVGFFEIIQPLSKFPCRCKNHSFRIPDGAS